MLNVHLWICTLDVLVVLSYVDCYVVAGGLMQTDADDFQAVRRASSGVCPGNATSAMMFARVSQIQMSSLLQYLVNIAGGSHCSSTKWDHVPVLCSAICDSHATCFCDEISEFCSFLFGWIPTKTRIFKDFDKILQSWNSFPWHKWDIFSGRYYNQPRYEDLSDMRWPRQHWCWAGKGGGPKNLVGGALNVLQNLIGAGHKFWSNLMWLIRTGTWYLWILLAWNLLEFNLSFCEMT